ncbi:hypothetical protein D9M68_865990 [compost metagenome]
MAPTSASSVIDLIHLMAASICEPSEDEILMVPSSSMLILAPVFSTISRITLPPVPITSRILSVGIFMVSMRGANSPTSERDAVMALAISPRMWIRPPLACSRAILMICSVMPAILISICSEVTPTSVPATLKSMSPR